MGDYERKLMEKLNEEETIYERMKHTRKGYHSSGDGCYSTRGSGYQEDDEWN